MLALMACSSFISCNPVLRIKITDGNITPQVFQKYAFHVLLVYSRLQVTGHNQLSHEGHMDQSVFDWSIVS